jgi:serine/threonine protein kinase
MESPARVASEASSPLLLGCSPSVRPCSHPSSLEAVPLPSHAFLRPNADEEAVTLSRQQSGVSTRFRRDSRDLSVCRGLLPATCNSSGSSFIWAPSDGVQTTSYETPETPCRSSAAHRSIATAADIPTVNYKTPVIQTDRAKRATSKKGRQVINDYILDIELGRGAYSVVHLARHRKTHHTVAIKILNRSRLTRLRLMADPHLRAAAEQRILTEIAILKRLRHPHIIALQEVIDDPESHELYLVLELAEEQSIMRLDKYGDVIPDEDGSTCIPEAGASRIARTLLSAIRFAHHHGVAHRDIKPENVLLNSNGEVKLADFGVSKMVDQWPLETVDSDRLRSVDHADDVDHPVLDDPHSPTGMRIKYHSEGTVCFMAPEFLDVTDRRGDDELDLRALFLADIWSFGVTMFTITVGQLPWKATSSETLLNAIRQSNEVLPFPPECAASPELRDFLRQAIRINPTSRSSLRQLAHHPWITRVSSSGPTLASRSIISGIHSFGGGLGERTVSGDDFNQTFQNFSFDTGSITAEVPPSALDAAPPKRPNTSSDVAQRPSSLPAGSLSFADSFSLLYPLRITDADVNDAVSSAHRHFTPSGSMSASFAGAPSWCKPERDCKDPAATPPEMITIIDTSAFPSRPLLVPEELSVHSVSVSESEQGQGEVEAADSGNVGVRSPINYRTLHVQTPQSYSPAHANEHITPLPSPGMFGCRVDTAVPIESEVQLIQIAAAIHEVEGVSLAHGLRGTPMMSPHALSQTLCFNTPAEASPIIITRPGSATPPLRSATQQHEPVASNTPVKAPVALRPRVSPPGE